MADPMSIAHRLINHPPTSPVVTDMLDETTARLLSVGLWIEQLPKGPERDHALEHLQLVSFWTKAAIARNQHEARPPKGFLPGDPVETPNGDGHVIHARWLDDVGQWEYAVALDEVDVAAVMRAMAGLVAGELPARAAARASGPSVTRFRAGDLTLIEPDPDDVKGVSDAR